MLENIFPLDKNYGISYYRNFLLDETSLIEHIKEFTGRIVGSNFINKFSCRSNNHEFDQEIGKLEQISLKRQAQIGSLISNNFLMSGKSPLLTIETSKPSILVDCPVVHQFSDPVEKWNGLIEQLEFLNDQDYDSLYRRPNGYNDYDDQEFPCDDFDFTYDNPDVKFKDVKINPDTVSFIFSCNFSGAETFVTWLRSELDLVDHLKGIFET